MIEDQDLTNFSVITVLNDLIAVEAMFLDEVQQANYVGNFSNMDWFQKVQEKRFLFNEVQANLNRFLEKVSIQKDSPHLLEKVLSYVKDGLTELWDKVTDLDAMLEQMECILSVSYYAFVEFFGKNELSVKRDIPMSECEMILIAKCLMEESTLVA